MGNGVNSMLRNYLQLSGQSTESSCSPDSGRSVCFSGSTLHQGDTSGGNDEDESTSCLCWMGLKSPLLIEREEPGLPPSFQVFFLLSVPTCYMPWTGFVHLQVHVQMMSPLPGALEFTILAENPMQQKQQQHWFFFFFFGWISDLERKWMSESVQEKKGEAQGFGEVSKYRGLESSPFSDIKLLDCCDCFLNFI